MLDAAACAAFRFPFSATFRYVRICVFHFEIYKQGAGEGGGGSPANEDTPLHPVKTYLLFRQIAGAKLRTLSIDLFSRNYNFSDDELF